MRRYLSDWLVALVAIAITFALGVVLDVDYTAFATGPVVFVVLTVVVGFLLELVLRRLGRSA